MPHAVNVSSVCKDTNWLGGEFSDSRGHPCRAQVVSDKANKSILVAIDRWQWLPKYKKEWKRTTKLMAHDERNECRVGDIVQVESSRCDSQGQALHSASLLR